MSEEPNAHDDEGTDLAKSIARGLAGRTGARRAKSRVKRVTPQASSAHPDERDPQTIDVSLERLINERGWATDLKVHALFVHWSAIVGREIAEHVTPISFADERLVVQADSSAWATQMKLLAPTVVGRLNEELGEESLRYMEVLGPRQKSWVKGKLRVKGRGPRDTYG